LVGEDVLNLPNILRISESFPNVSQLSVFNFKEYSKFELTVPSHVFPSLKFYEGAYPTILPFVRDRQVTHLQVREITNPLLEILQATKHQLESIAVEGKISDWMEPKAFEGIDQCSKV
jgi:hypothetical protein